jgi:hypothetical protein
MHLFHRQLPILSACATLAFLVSATSASADQTIATTPRPTTVAAGQGLVAFSKYDSAIHEYRLMIARHGRVERASVAPSPTPFEVDVGPTGSGRPYLVYSRCESRSTPVPKGCDIYAYDPDTHRDNRYDASSASHSEVHPTYWRGRVAFVRYYGSASDPRPIVYTRRARSSRTSHRLPGLPDRRCMKYAGCGAVTGRIDELELYGDHLAQTAFTVTHNRFNRKQTEVRLVNVESESSQQIAARGSGESFQEFIGLSFRAGRLFTYFTCHGDTGGCLHGIGGAYRYRYSTGDWSKDPSTDQLSAFAVSNLGTIEVESEGTERCGTPARPTAPCSVDLVQPPLQYLDTSRPPR